MPISPAWVALCLVEHLGAKKLRALVTHFGRDLNAILAADERELRRVPGIGVKIAAGITSIDVRAAAESLARWEAAGVALITLVDPAYPARLRRIDDAPPILFVRGDLNAGLRPGARPAAIVGTRQPAPDALLTAKRIAYGLGQRGWDIVSGMALGIDAGGHMGALAANAGTVAVLGSGVLTPYPPENRPLADAIRERGALIGEVSPEANPSRTHLVARNRLISGLSDAVIVVQTEADGGAMHAARRAFQQGRRVFTLDMDVTGNRLLAQEGAVMLPDADALIDAVNALEMVEDAFAEDWQEFVQLPLLGT